MITSLPATPQPAAPVAVPSPFTAPGPAAPLSTAPPPATSLSRGRHVGPADGACVMELASTIAGEPWSDHPACVHPVLAAVARGVNDGAGDAGRAQLTLLAPAMIGTAAIGTAAIGTAAIGTAAIGAPPGRDHGGSWFLASCARLVLRCAEAALDHSSADGPEMVWARQVALAVLARHGGRASQGRGDHIRASGITARLAVALLGWAGLLARIYPGSAARQAAHAVALLRTPAGEENDRRLVQLLEGCVADCTRPAVASWPVPGKPGGTGLPDRGIRLL